jgi:hypothetical protein
VSVAHDNQAAIAQVETEKAVLGSIMLSPEIFQDIADRLEAVDFYDLRNQLIFEAITAVYTETKTVEIDTLCQWLKDRHTLEDAGGVVYIASLEMNVFSTGAAPEQAEIVAEMARRREVLNVAQWAASAAAGRIDDEITNSTDIAARMEQCAKSVKGFWSIPKPVGYGKLPTFPVEECFPPWLSSMVLAVAEHLQVPVDLPAMIALGCTAGSIQRKIAVKANKSWREPLCLWCIPCLETGNRKTATLSLMDAPLRKYSEEKSDEWSKNQRLIKEKKAALQSKLKKLMKGVADGDEASEREAEAVNEQMEALDRDNQQERLLAEDVTPEALESLLAGNNERIIIKSDEAGFFKGLSRYSDQTNVDLINKAYSASPHYRDRVGAGFSRLKSPCLTLILAPQPKILKDNVLADEKDSGLPARCLFVLPTSLIGSRVTKPPDISHNVRSHYFDSMMSICRLPWNDIDGSKDDPHLISLSRQAEDLYDEFSAEIEPRMTENGEYHEFVEWARKMFGTTIRIAGVLHVLDKAEYAEPWKHEMSAGTMAKAIKIMRYLVPHARAAFSIIDGASTVNSAEIILRWIKRANVTVFTARECLRQCPTRFSGKDGQSAMWNALGHLEQLDYIREARRPESSSRRGQKPSPAFRVNPHLKHSLEEILGDSGGEN